MFLAAFEQSAEQNRGRVVASPQCSQGVGAMRRFGTVRLGGQ
jgi:hypothetical protein